MFKMKKINLFEKFKPSEQKSSLKEGKKEEVSRSEKLIKRANELFKEIQRHKVIEEKLYKTPRSKESFMKIQHNIALKESEKELKEIIDRLKKIYGIEWSPPQEE